MTDHAAVCRAALPGRWCPGGRFVGEFGGHGNVARHPHSTSRRAAAAGTPTRWRSTPWTFPTDREWAATLDEAGFRIDLVELFALGRRPLPTDMEGWLATFAEPFLNALPEADREAVRDEAVDLLRPALCDRSGHWIADYTRLRFVAVVA